MKTNWQTKKLGEVCEIGAGNSAPQKKELFDGGKYPFFRTSDVGRIRFGVIDDSTDKLNEIGIKKLHFYKKGTLLLPKSGASTFLNHRVLMTTDGYVSSHLATLKAKDNILDDRFLLYFSSTIDSRNLMQDQNYPSLRLSDIQEINILLPSFPEQQHIVAILDEAFAAIATATENAEKNLQNARELFESYLQGVFANTGDGWKEKTVGEIAQCSLGKMLDKAKNRGEPKKYLRNLNVRWFEFNLDDLLQMRFTPEEQEKYTAVRGDVLICEGGYPGRAAIWNEDYPIYFQKALHRVRFDVPDHSKWFLYYLYLQGKKGDLKKYFSGTGIQHFTGEALHRFVLPVAPIEQIMSIVARLDALSAETKKLEAIYRHKLAGLDELKKSVLQKAFNGGLA